MKDLNFTLHIYSKVGINVLYMTLDSDWQFVTDRFKPHWHWMGGTVLMGTLFDFSYSNSAKSKGERKVGSTEEKHETPRLVK